MTKQKKPLNKSHFKKAPKAFKNHICKLLSRIFFSLFDYLGFFQALLLGRSNSSFQSSSKQWYIRGVTSRQAFPYSAAPFCRSGPPGPPTSSRVLAGEGHGPGTDLSCSSPVAGGALTEEAIKKSRQKVGKIGGIFMTQTPLKGKQSLHSLKITEEQQVLAEKNISCLCICTLVWGTVQHQG